MKKIRVEYKSDLINLFLLFFNQVQTSYNMEKRLRHEFQ